MKQYINKIISGDCFEIMKKLPDKCVDLVLTDPPYGITKEKWDNVPSKDYFNEIFRISKEQLFFGGQFFDLPKKEGWVIWYKKAYWMSKKFTKSDVNEAELLWISKKIKTKVIEYHISGNIEGFRGEKLKPDYKKPKNYYTSQKPFRLVKFLIQEFFPESDVILDPFVGTGTTCLAAKDLGKNYIGIELQDELVKIANSRLVVD